MVRFSWALSKADPCHHPSLYLGTERVTGVPCIMAVLENLCSAGGGSSPC